MDVLQVTTPSGPYSCFVFPNFHVISTICVCIFPQIHDDLGSSYSHGRLTAKQNELPLRILSWLMELQLGGKQA
jgi:hypothetical protein